MPTYLGRDTVRVLGSVKEHPVEEPKLTAPAVDATDVALMLSAVQLGLRDITVVVDAAQQMLRDPSVDGTTLRARLRRLVDAKLLVGQARVDLTGEGERALLDHLARSQRISGVAHLIYNL